MSKEVKWTNNQTAVIEHRGNNLLVSAAAGSGKTAVLVERIIQRIMDPEDAFSVDNILVVTFTRAAAGEMQSRISDAISKKLELDPDNLYLQEQIALIHNAQISTIDSFCGSLVKNHFYEIGLDPDIQTLDPSAEKMLFDEAYNEFIGAKYEEDDEDFISFVNRYSGDKNDDAITKNISALYEVAMSMPWPREWLESLVNDYDIETLEDLRATRWFQALDEIEEISDELAEDYLRDAKELYPDIKCLSDLAVGFYDYYQNYKLEKNVATFADKAHFALDILIDRDTKEATATCLALREHYQSIIVDEYQDVNDLQEMILSSLGKLDDEGGDFFAVGDVKQSIYGFRQSKPEIFYNKMSDYASGKKQGDNIVLDSNFRSRKQVLDFANLVFERVMGSSIGGIDYTDDAYLKLGAEYPEAKDESIYRPEILLADKDENNRAKELSSVKTTVTLEAMVIADKIKSLMRDFPISTRQEDDPYRPCKYSDIAILLNTATHANDFKNILLDYGIPCMVAKSKGYFNNVEVRTVLSYLSILNNPNDDIELTTVLHSPIYNLTNDDLARIRLAKSDSSLYGALCQYVIDNPEDELVLNAYEDIMKYRHMVKDTPVNVLLEDILYDTGYLDYVTSLAAGDIRSDNLYKLIDEAINFAMNNNGGLVSFINYVKELESYEIELGDGGELDPSIDCVRIYTQHKSKGLEFPICFVSAIDNQFKAAKTGENGLLISNKYGIAIKKVDREEGYIRNNLVLNAFKSLIKFDDIGEYLRVLYVALTRPKEKLYITGTHKKVEYLGEADKAGGDGDILLSHDVRYAFKSFYDVIEKSIMEPGLFHPQWIGVDELNLEKVITGISMEESKHEIFKLQDQVLDEDIHEFACRLDYVYPYSSDSAYKAKYSVSEIKHASMEDEEAEELFKDREKIARVPSFMRNDPKADYENKGALYGTAVHRYFECFDFTRSDYSESVDEQLLSHVVSGKMKQEDVDRLSVQKLKNFAASQYAKRMHEAAIRGDLFLEKPFVLSADPAQLFNEESAESDNVLVQGIIDVFFIEEDGIILLDYKTDSVKDGQELIDRYKAQMDLYSKALSKVYNLPVKEIVLYSFSLDTEVLV